jgi:hypothetical protein
MVETVGDLVGILESANSEVCVWEGRELRNATRSEGSGLGRPEKYDEQT